MARDFLTVFTRYVYSKVLKKNRVATKVTLKVHIRAENAPFEPSKYGGMGLCDLKTASQHIGDRTPKVLKNTVLFKF